MKTLLKIAGLSTLVLLVAVVGLTLFIRSYLTDEKIKALLIPQAEKQLGRTVEIGDIDVSIFRGITVHSFLLKEADGTTDFVRVDRFILRYDLSNLLRRKLSVSEILLKDPEVRLVRDRNGEFNYSSLALLQKKKGAEKKPAPGADSAAGATALPVALTLDAIRLENAHITIHDELGEIPDLDGRANLLLKLDLRDLAALKYEGTMDFDADGLYNGLKPHMEGEIDFSTDTLHYDLALRLDDEEAALKGEVTGLGASPDIKLDLSGDQLNIDKILALAAGASKAAQAKDDPGDKAASGRVATATQGAAGKKTTGKKAAGKGGTLPAGLTAAGNIRVKRVLYRDLALDDFHLDYRLREGTLQIDNLGSTVAGGTIGGNGAVDLGRPQMMLRSTVDIKGVDLNNLLQAMGISLADTQPGRCDIHVNVAGPLAGGKRKNPLTALSARGTARMDSILHRNLAITAISAPFSLSGGRATLKKMSLTVAGGTLTTDLQLNLLAGNMPFSGTTYIAGLDVQDLLTALEKPVADVTLGRLQGTLSYSGAARPAKGRTGDGKLTDTLAADGTLAMDRVVYRELQINELNLPLHLKDNRLEIRNYSAATAGGRIRGDLRVDIGGSDLPFSGRADLAGVVIQEIVTGIGKQVADLSLGALDCKMTFKGRGRPGEGKKLTDSVTARGTIELDRLVYKELPVEKVHLPLELKNGILQLTSFTARTAEGRLGGNARVDLRPPEPVYKGNISADSLLLRKLLTGLEIPAAGIITGRARTVLNFAGQGKKWEVMRNALNLEGTYGLENGRLGTTPVSAAIASLLRLDELKNLDFKTLGGNIRLANGLLELNSSMRGNDVDFSTRGTIGLDGSLELPITLRFSPRLTARLKKEASVAKYLTDAEGRAEIRLKLTGTVTKPIPTLDLAGLQEQAVTKLREKAGAEVKKRLGKELNKYLPGLGSDGKNPQPPTPQATDKQAPPPQKELPTDGIEDSVDKAIEGVLKGLFGN